MNYDENDIINKIDPRKNPNWKFAVVAGILALYHRQTEDEKAMRSTFYKNAEGFNSHDASKGAKLAKYAIENNLNLPDNSWESAVGIVFKYRKQLARILSFREEQAEQAKKLEDFKLQLVN